MGETPKKTETVDVTVIIVNWNTSALLVECLARVVATVRELSYEVFVVDNASTDDSVEKVRERFPEVHLIVNPRNEGYAAACNQALGQMKGRYALLLNTDALLMDGAVTALFDFMEETPTAGMACGQLRHPDGRPQNSVAPFPSWSTLLTSEAFMKVFFPSRFPGKGRMETHPVEVDSCIGACMMVRKTAMNRVGLFDERYFFFFEETDWALRMHRGGWKVFFVPAAQVIHSQGQSVGPGVASRKLFYRARYAYFGKWHPKSTGLVFVVIFLRLLINTLLTSLGVLLTLGLSGGLRRRLGVYLRLIAWHLAGCPEK